VEEKEEEPEQREEVQEMPPPEPEESHITEEQVCVRILKEQPPIAQPEGDYYLHKNDIIYIPSSFAKMLNSHGICQYIEKGKKL
jgi:DNA replication factor GINS